MVAVIGAGHHNGIQQTLDELESRDAEPEIAVPTRFPSRTGTTVPIR